MLSLHPWKIRLGQKIFEFDISHTSLTSDKMQDNKSMSATQRVLKINLWKFTISKAVTTTKNTGPHDDDTLQTRIFSLQFTLSRREPNLCLSCSSYQ